MYSEDELRWWTALQSLCVIGLEIGEPYSFARSAIRIPIH